jgi:hypothetical protein
MDQDFARIVLVELENIAVDIANENKELTFPCDECNFTKERIKQLILIIRDYVSDTEDNLPEVNPEEK